MTTSPLEHHAEELRVQGYTIVKGILDPTQIRLASAALDSILERERDIGSQRGWHTEAHQISHVLPQKDPVFFALCQNARLLELMRLVLGSNCIIGTVNGLSMVPLGKAQSLHRDQGESVPGTVLTVNALHTLDDFTVANGATRVVPFSQNRTASREEDEREAIYLEAPAGSLIAYDGGLMHAGSANTTEQPRRALHAFFLRPWIRPHWDFSRSFSPETIAQLQPEEKRLFGFDDHSRWYDYRTDQVFTTA
jgi:ectoine hydroxylase-related dioxygenase (phytanoyl-CoA dioxygenase family)